MESITEDKLEFCSDSIEYKSENGKFYTEGFLEVSGDVDIKRDVVTDHCIDSIVAQCLGKEMKAVTSTTATKRAMKMSADHSHVQLGGDRREMPVGKIVDAKKVVENGKSKAWIKTEVNEFHPEYKSIRGCIENGYFDAYSMEFIPTDVPVDERKSGGKRVLNDVKLTGGAYTGRPVLPSAEMTNFYAKSMTFEEFKSMMDSGNDMKNHMEDPEYRTEFEKQRYEHPSIPDEMIHTIVKDHMKMNGMEGKSESCSKEIPMENKEEKKSEIAQAPKEEAKAEKTFTMEEVKAMIQEEFKSRDLKTLEQVKSTIADEIKKNAEELKSKVLVNSEEKKSDKDMTFGEQWAKAKGIIK